MQIQKIMLLSLFISISCFLSACSHVAGNVIPESGLTMESIYDDDLGDHPASANVSAVVFTDTAQSVKAGPLTTASSSEGRYGVGSPTFSILNNPELKLYVFPHLAGSELLPIPGYWTAFSAYSRNYYALPLAVQPENRK